ncbi:MAG: hypothetical protein KBA28_07110 [Syntrophaceae bacterium]|jgi:flagellar basal body rod protein FlgG|nr:hypothetical protein [Syntrophaceae bacterium]HOC60396.1 flagellar basal body protein [Smithellaceae bacterium]HQM45775.1 flagellar basal body protein [Smithellaceae bacterium]
MMSAFHISLSALRAFDTKLDVHANNLANVNTDKFKKSRAELQEEPSGGVRVSISQQEEPGDTIFPDATSGEKRELSNVSIEEEVVHQMVTQYALEANILSLKTADEMQSSLLDILS